MDCKYSTHFQSGEIPSSLPGIECQLPLLNAKIYCIVTDYNTVRHKHLKFHCGVMKSKKKSWKPLGSSGVHIMFHKVHHRIPGTSNIYKDFLVNNANFLGLRTLWQK